MEWVKTHLKVEHTTRICIVIINLSDETLEEIIEHKIKKISILRVMFGVCVHVHTTFIDGLI